MATLVLDVKRTVDAVSYNRVVWRKCAEKGRRLNEILLTEYWGKA